MSQKQVEAGSLTPEELLAFNGTRSTVAQILQQIGGLEVQKNRLLSQIDDAESKAQEVLLGARVRLGISEDEPWRIQSDGKIFTVVETTEE